MKQTALVSKILKCGVIGILLLVPFHAVFTTWLGSNFGHLDAFRIWKELLIAALTLVALWVMYATPELRKHLTKDRLLILILLYVLLHLVLGVVALYGGKVNQNALIYALLINLRFLVFLMVAFVVASVTDLHRHWKRLLLWPAVVVVMFGLLQLLVLPLDFLRHFGYGPDTIPIVQTVDEKIEYRRIQSTLRGANPLGAYLVLIITAYSALYLARKYPKSLLDRGSYSVERITHKVRTKEYNLTINYLMLTVAAATLLFFTYSRSAWLGAAVSLGVVGVTTLRSKLFRRAVVVGGVVVALVLGGAVWLLRDNNRVQNTLFHSDETSISTESSNTGRARALTDGVKSVVDEPLGRGPGTAGPASMRNNHTPRIAENYYIQIAQEVGLIGLALFLAINFLIAQTLWQQRRDVLSMVLLASLLGITLINMLSHAWADDTLSLIWWGMAGIALGARATQQPAVNWYTDDKHHEIAKQKTSQRS